MQQPCHRVQHHGNLLQCEADADVLKGFPAGKIRRPEQSAQRLTDTAAAQPCHQRVHSPEDQAVQRHVDAR